ncbi:hypothetical protein MALU111345_18745 [Marinicrinis lubricantis]
MKHRYDAIVIGAGQAGLAAGYHLKKKNRHFLIIDQAEQAGDSWRNRYDTLQLFTPRWYSSLPGLSLLGDPGGYPCKDEMAQYFQNYAEFFQLPIQFKTTVTSLTKVDEEFFIQTAQGEEYTASQVIVATGAFHKPFIPEFAKVVPEQMKQLHSSIPKCFKFNRRSGSSGGSRQFRRTNCSRACEGQGCVLISWTSTKVYAFRVAG